MRKYTHYSLLAHNTFGIEAYCDSFYEFETIAELQQVLRELDADSQLLILGGGSNMLFAGDFHGTVLHSAIKGCEATVQGDDVFLRCGSGETWDDVVALCVSEGWHGAENLSLIPGTVGASAVQNIGAYGVEVKDIIYKVEAVDVRTGECHSFSVSDCQYGYRKSRFKTEWQGRYVITHVTYRLSRCYTPNLTYGNIQKELSMRGISEPTSQQLRDVIIDIRNAKLPDVKVEGNAGSFFMNPVVSKEKYLSLLATWPDMPHYTVDDSHEKIPAGWLIEKCGWKGRTLGRAGVHSKQALVLVNRGGATGQDVLTLCESICCDVKRIFDVEIRPEVIFVGRSEK